MSDRENIINGIVASETDFQKNLIYISAGALILSLSFNELLLKKQVLEHTGVLVASWIFFTITLLVNLGSHLISLQFMFSQLNELDTQDANLASNTKNRNLIIHGINWFSFFTLSIGVVLLIVYSSINI